MTNPLTAVRSSFHRLPSFVQNVGFVLTAQVLSIGIGLLYNVIIARATGPEGKGIYSLATLAPMMLTTLTACNMGAGAIYYIGNKKHAPGQVLGTLFSVCALLTVVFGTFYLGFLPDISRVAFKGLRIDYLVLSFFIYPAAMLSIPFNGIIIGSQHIKAASRIDLLRTFAMLVLIAFFILALHAGVEGAIAAVVASFWVALFASYRYARTLEKFKLSFNPAIIRDVAGYSVKGFIGSIIQLFNYRLDVLLINFFLTPVNVGIYTVSVMIAEMIWYIPNAVGHVLFPKISASDSQTADRITPQVSRISLVLTAITGMVILFISSPVIQLLFGDRFSAAARPLNILIPGVIALGITKVLGNDLSARGKPEYPTIASAVALVLSAGISIMAIPEYGIIGAACATSLSYCASAVAISLFYWRHTKNHPLVFLIPQKCDIVLLKDVIKGALSHD